MGQNWYAKLVQCPFYRDSLPQKIICEGPAKLSNLHFAFSTRSDTRSWQDKYCAAEYWDCPICHMMEVEYGEFDG